MKLTSVLILAVCLQASATGFSQKAKISLDVRQKKLEDVLREIETQTSARFVFSKSLIEYKEVDEFRMKKVPLTSVLDSLCASFELSYQLINDSLIAIGEKIRVPGRGPIVLTGRVVNDLGMPLTGVNIKIRGRKAGVSTDDVGNYTIEVFENDFLEVSFIGYVTQVYAVRELTGNPPVLNIVLQTQVSELSQVIVTGYQTIAKERSAGSFAKPDDEILKNRSTSMNILERLDGLVPGLTVNNAPGAEQNQFLIRGLNTIGMPNPANPGQYTGTSRSPLFVVDGISMENVSSINPQDVADITVLKDATASSIWGARASNGVIVIVTKRGAANTKMKVSYDGFVSFQGKPDLNYIPVLSSRQFIDAAQEIFSPELANNRWGTVSAYVNTGSAGVPPHEVVLYNRYRGLISDARAQAQLDSLASINNISQIEDLWYRNAALTNHTVSVRGGGNMHSYYGSFAYTGTQSNRPGESNDSYKINLRQDLNLNKRLSMYLITDLTHTNTGAGRTINVTNTFLPYQLFRDENGINLSMPYTRILSDSTRIAYEQRSKINLDYVPLDEMNYGYTKSDALLSRITGGVTLKLIKGLRYEGVFGLVKGSNRTRSFDSEQSFLVRNELVQFTVAPTVGSTPQYYLPVTGGHYSVNNTSQSNWTVRNQFIYDNSWQDNKHQLTVLAGQEASQQLMIANSSLTRGYDETLQTYGNVDYATLGVTGLSGPVMANNIGKSILSGRIFTELEARSRLTSHYGNIAYTFNGKYSMNGSWRIDESSLFGKDKSAQNKPVWSIGGKWIMSNEAFMDDVKWIDLLALRTTYGITGNSPDPGVAASFDILVSQSSPFLLNGKGLKVGTTANNKLTWERTSTVNLGLDFAFLKNRIRGALDVYKKSTTDLLGDLAVNPFTGYATVVGNFGDLENTGVELAMSGTPVRTKNFDWNVMLTMAHNKNKITKLNNLTTISRGLDKVRQRFLTDYPAMAIFAFHFAGLDDLGDPQIYRNDKSITKTPNVSLPEDILFMGTEQPVWNGGFSNNFRYRNFELAVNAVYNLGHVMRRDVNTNFSGGRLVQTNMSFNGNVHSEFSDRWTPDNRNTSVPSYVSDGSVSNTRRDIYYYTAANINVVSASFIKIRDVSLFYSIPPVLTSKLRIEQIKLRAQISNVMFWKSNKYGIDPEFHYAGSGALYGTRSMPYAQGAFTLGAHVSF